MKKSESIVELSKAMNEFHKNVTQPLKDKDNPFFKSKYVPLENVVEAINNEAPKQGLAFTQWALNGENGTVGVATLLMHSSGEFIEYPPIFSKPDKPNAQGLGSVITYLKRYTLSAIFGITSDEDDDGNEAFKYSQQNNSQQTQEVGKPILLAKFKQGGGTEEQFGEWYSKQVASGFNHNQMDQYLTKALMKKSGQQ